MNSPEELPVSEDVASENYPGGILHISEQGNILGANEAAGKLTGYSPGALVELSIRDIFPLLQKVAEGREKRGHEDHWLCHECSMITSGGRKKTVRMQMIPVPGSTILCIINPPSGIAGITESPGLDGGRGDTLESLRRREAETDRLLSVIAHDLRSPFNAILGLTYLLREEFDNMSHDDIHEIIATLRSSSVNLFNLLENLLELTRMRRGTISPLFPEPLLLHSAVIQGQEGLLEAAALKGLVVRIDIPQDLVVHADHTAFNSILRNLLSNSIKFTLSSGLITLNAEVRDDGFVHCRLADTGIGIEPHLLPRLLFYPGEHKRSGTNGEQGSGFGLAIARAHLERQGCSLTLESEVGRGTTACFTLPAADSDSR